MTITLSSHGAVSTPSVYFGEVYGLANARESGGRWVTVAETDGSWQVPLIIREVAEAVTDAATPYGYGGVHDARMRSGNDLSLAWEQTRAALADAGAISVFFRFAPFLDSANPAAFDGVEGLEIRQVNETVSIPVGDADAVWSQMQGRARTAVRKATTHGYTAAVVEASDALADPSHPFRQLYTTTMNRIGARSSYYFSDEYYRALADGLASGLRLAVVTGPDGEAAAAALILCDRDIAHYHLSGSDPRAARDGANNLLIWTILEWAGESGFQSVHLGGGVTRGDNLARFKESFGGERLPFSVGRWVLEQHSYDARVAARAEELGCTVAALHAADFFPAYRGVPRV